MSYIWNKKTNKFDVHITIPSIGIKEPQTTVLGSFDSEIEAAAGAKTAQAMLNNDSIFKMPTNKQINRWISHQLK